MKKPVKFSIHTVQWTTLLRSKWHITNFHLLLKQVKIEIMSFSWWIKIVLTLIQGYVLSCFFIMHVVMIWRMYFKASFFLLKDFSIFSFVYFFPNLSYMKVFWMYFMYLFCEHSNLYRSTRSHKIVWKYKLKSKI